MKLLRYIRAQICLKLFWKYKEGRPEWHYAVCRYWLKKGWLNWK